MTGRNLVEVESYVSKQGWIETIMPSSARTVVVMLTPLAEESGRQLEDAADGTTLTLPLLIQDGSKERLEYSNLVAQDTWTDETGTCLLYQIPQPELQAAQAFLYVRVRPGSGWRQDGVIGLTESDAGKVKASWAEIILEPRAISTADAQDRLTRLVLRSA